MKFSWAFIVPVISLLFSCQSKNRVYHELVNDIKDDFKIEYLNQLAYPLGSSDSSMAAMFARSKRVVPESEMKSMEDQSVHKFRWDKSLLTGVTVASIDSFSNMMKRSKTDLMVGHISAPIVSSYGEWAIAYVGSFLAVSSARGHGCAFLFHKENNQWIVKVREGCKDY